MPARADSKLDVTRRPVALRALDLDTFFRPRTVAVIGASDSPRRPNAVMYRKIRAWAEHHGAVVHPVNPNRPQIDGVPCHASVLDIPGDVDLVCILVSDALGVLKAVIEKKARFAVIFTAGFAEVGPDGEVRQAELEQLIARNDVRVLGPNTNLNAFEMFREDLDSKAIALITQSGHQGRPIFQGQDLGVRLSHWAPTGNEADLEFADFAAYFSDRPEVGAIASYIEGFKDGRTLLLAADRAACNGVPITCVKIGRTAEGRSMAKSHTGHLTGSDAVMDAAFRQFGITRVDGLDELLDTAATFARTTPPRGDGVVIYSISGGTGAHMADMAAAAGLRLPRLTEQTQRQLHEWIPPYLRVSNPVDNGGAPSSDWRGRKIIDAILADPNCDMLICPITGALASAARLARDLVEASRSTDKPVLVIWGSPVGDEPEYREVLLTSTVPVFRTFRNAVRAAKAYFDYHEFRSRYRSPFDRPVLRPSKQAGEAKDVLGAGGALTEVDAKRLLATYDIPVTDDNLCSTVEEAVAAAQALGRPCVMKIVSAEVGHKSDGGFVKLGVATATDVRATFADFMERAPSAGGVLVSEMVTGGVETVVGVSHDDLFGPVVMVGLGGVFVEVLNDVTFRIPPFDRDEALRMLGELAGAKLFAGLRGRQKADVGALADALVKVGRLALDLHDDLLELDINPLVVRDQGVIALDALVVPRGAG